VREDLERFFPFQNTHANVHVAWLKKKHEESSNLKPTE
jgi:hypothetical protein